MNAILREKMKQTYQRMRKRDGVDVGRKVNALVQQIHNENRKQPRDGEKLQSLVQQIEELTFEKRFREEFPDFPSFKAYVKKEKLSIKDLSMM